MGDLQHRLKGDLVYIAEVGYLAYIGVLGFICEREATKILKIKFLCHTQKKRETFTILAKCAYTQYLNSVLIG